jgi:hypothetical protein
MSEVFRIKVRTTLTGLLPRLRGTLPIPLTHKEIYAAAFPHARLCDWLYDPLPTDMRNNALPYINMAACTRRASVVHFSLQTREELDVLGENDLPETFWLLFDRHVAAPESGGVFLLTQAMRNTPALRNWYHEARKLDDLISDMECNIYAAAAGISTPTELMLAWPEVAAAVPGLSVPIAKKRIAARSPNLKLKRAKVETFFPPDKMQRLSDLLATAIMLPEAQILKAWVGLYDDLNFTGDYLL